MYENFQSLDSQESPKNSEKKIKSTLIEGRSKRENAGNKLGTLLRAETSNFNDFPIHNINNNNININNNNSNSKSIEITDADVDNIFLEDEDDDEYVSSFESEEDVNSYDEESDSLDDDLNLKRKRSNSENENIENNTDNDESDQSDENESSQEIEEDEEDMSDSDSSVDYSDDDEEGERELQKQEKEAKKRKQAEDRKKLLNPKDLNSSIKKKVKKIKLEDNLNHTTSESKKFRPTNEKRRSSTRATAVMSKKLLLERLKESDAKREKIISRNKASAAKKDTHHLTQEELLAEAIETERKNKQSLKDFYSQEEEKKQNQRQAFLSKRKPLTSFIRFHSSTENVPSIKKFIEELEFIPIERIEQLNNQKNTNPVRKYRRKSSIKSANNQQTKHVMGDSNNNNENMQLINKDNSQIIKNYNNTQTHYNNMQTIYNNSQIIYQNSTSLVSSNFISSTINDNQDVNNRIIDNKSDQNSCLINNINNNQPNEDSILIIKENTKFDSIENEINSNTQHIKTNIVNDSIPNNIEPIANDIEKNTTNSLEIKDESQLKVNKMDVHNYNDKASNLMVNTVSSVTINKINSLGNQNFISPMCGSETRENIDENVSEIANTTQSNEQMNVGEINGYENTNRIVRISHLPVPNQNDENLNINNSNKADPSVEFNVEDHILNTSEFKNKLETEFQTVDDGEVPKVKAATTLISLVDFPNELSDTAVKEILFGNKENDEYTITSVEKENSSTLVSVFNENSKAHYKDSVTGFGYNSVEEYKIIRALCDRTLPWLPVLGGRYLDNSLAAKGVPEGFFGLNMVVLGLSLEDKRYDWVCN